MAKIKYIGPYDEVIVPLPLGGEASVKRGEHLKTSDDHAANLGLQTSWEVEAKPEPKKAKSQAVGESE